MTKAAAWLRARAENIAATFFAAMFFSFMIQIYSRYLLNDPYSWTIEASLTAWLWIVFWCSGFLLNNRDHVRFDVLYGLVHPGMQRVFTLISVVAIVLAFAVSLPANYGFVTYMKIERSVTLGFRLDYVFSVYIVFAIAIIARYTFYTIRVVLGEDPEEVMNQGGTNGTLP